MSNGKLGDHMIMIICKGGRLPQEVSSSATYQCSLIYTEIYRGNGGNGYISNYVKFHILLNISVCQ